MSTEEWLKGLKPVQSKTAQSTSQSYDNDDLKGVRVEHSLDEIKSGVSQILVAKDVDILADDDDADHLTLVMPFATGGKKPGANLSFDNDADEDEMVASSFVIGDESFERRNEELGRDQAKRKEYDTNLQTTIETVEPVNAKKSRRTIRRKDVFDDAPLLQPRAAVLDEDLVMVGEEEDADDDLHRIISETRQKNIELIRQRLAEEEEDDQEMDYDILEQASNNVVVSDTTSFLKNIIRPSDSLKGTTLVEQQQEEEPMKLNTDIKLSEIPDRPGIEESVVSSLEEPLASSTLGVGPTLALLRMRGVPLKFSSDNQGNSRKEVQLGYYDEFGNEISAKEAYKQLSHRFHGNKPGKNKEEKRLKKLSEAKKALHSGMDKVSSSPSRKKKKRPAKKNSNNKPAQAVAAEPPRKPRIFGMQL